MSKLLFPSKGVALLVKGLYGIMSLASREIVISQIIRHESGNNAMSQLRYYGDISCGDIHGCESPMSSMRDYLFHSEVN